MKEPAILLSGFLVGFIFGELIFNGGMADSWCRSLDYEGVANYWSATGREFRCYRISGDIKVEQTFKWGKKP